MVQNISTKSDLLTVLSGVKNAATNKQSCLEKYKNLWVICLKINFKNQIKLLDIESIYV